MKTYLRIFQSTIKEYFVYRLSFILWRFRMFLSLLVTFFLWFAVFDRGTTFGSYERATLLSYILFANVIAFFVMGTRTSDVAGDINDGKIINYLLKPVSFFKYIFVRDLADKAMNTIFVFFELAIIILLFHPPLVAPSNLALAGIFIINGVFLSFFINLLLSFIGFWTTEVWAPRFLFMMLVFFLSGSYFPLDLLPAPIYHLVLLTPFPYLYFLPTKLLVTPDLSKLPNVLLILVTAIGWTLVAWRCTLLVWNRGNKSFSFWGR